MAERRMFAKSIVLADKFLDLPMSTRCLYMTFGMVADDDGFVNNPRSVMRQCGASDGDARALINEGYIIPFDSGVIVITHWRLHNYLRSDRYKSTDCVAEKAQLTISPNGAYSENLGIPPGIPTGIPLDDTGKDSIGKSKDSIGKDNNIGEKTAVRFIPPSVEQVQAYCLERKNGVDAEAFVDFYEAKGWMVGKNRMKDWKAAVRNWERGDKQRQPAKQTVTDYGSPEDFYL